MKATMGNKVEGIPPSISTTTDTIATASGSSAIDNGNLVTYDIDVSDYTKLYLTIYIASIQNPPQLRSYSTPLFYALMYGVGNPKIEILRPERKAYNQILIAYKELDVSAADTITIVNAYQASDNDDPAVYVRYGGVRE